MPFVDNKDNVLPKGSLILITGSSGYLASNVVYETLAAGYKVRGTARTSEKVEQTKKTFNSPDYEAVVVPEMEPEGAFDEAVKGVDAIIHTASPLTFSPDPTKVVAPAMKGATSILNSALKEPKVKRFVFTSSSSASTLPKSGVKFHIDKNLWNKDVDDFRDFPPPYKEENAFKVYAASKTAAEEAVWKFVEQQKPSFVVNCVCPNYIMGRILSSGGATGGLIVQTYTTGAAPWKQVPPQYMINVIDVARIHLTALLDGQISDERIFAFAFPFNWNDVLDHFREIKPDGKWEENKPNAKRDESTVDNALGRELLAKWYGQTNGYIGLKESLDQTIKGV